MEIETKAELTDQHFWNVVFLVLSIAIFVVSMAVLGAGAAYALTGMTAFQFVVLALATFRLTRLLVSDHIMLWLRDLCVNVNEATSPETGLVCVVREKPTKGVRLLLANLLGCPWCVGVWAAFIVIFLYIGAVLDVFPAGRVIVYIFALAGGASIVQTTIGALQAIRVPVVAHTEHLPTPPNGKRYVTPNVCTDCGIE